jgi:hypothetical protein
VTAFTKVSVLAVAIFVVIGLFGVSSHVDAAYVKKKAETAKNQPSSAATSFAKRLARECVGNKWTQPGCLKMVSQNNLVMTSNYMAALQEANKRSHVETVKQHCAASTAANKGEYPANAMRSAFVECVNIIADTASATGVKPDQSQFQLLVGAVQCLDKNQACSAIEQALSRYK